MGLLFLCVGCVLGAWLMAALMWGLLRTGKDADDRAARLHADEARRIEHARRRGHRRPR